MIYLIKSNLFKNGFLLFVHRPPAKEKSSFEKIKHINVENGVLLKSPPTETDLESMSLIKKETVDNKSTTPAVLQYFKACDLKFVVIFLSLYLVSFVAQVSSNFWLSDLSNNYQQYLDTKSKLVNYGIYFLLGFLSCKLFYQVVQLIKLK